MDRGSSAIERRDRDLQLERHGGTANPVARPERYGQPEVSALLRRAIEVASERRDPGIADGLTIAEIDDVAREVGVPSAAVATALAEARAGLGHRRGRLAELVQRMVGPSRVWATVHLVDDEALAAEAVRRWLEVDHGLNAYVRPDGVVVASPRGGLSGAIGGGLRALNGRGGLRRVRGVRAAAVAVGDDGVVCVVADVANRRNDAMIGGSLMTLVPAAGLVTGAVIGAPLLLAGLPVAAGLGVGTAWLTHRRTVRDVTAEVEATANAVARDERPVHPVEGLITGRSSRPRRRLGRGRNRIGDPAIR